MIVLEYHGEESEKAASKIDHLKHKISDDLNSALKNLLDKYCSTLCTTTFSLITVAGLFLYWSISIYGTVTINVELKPEYLIKKDSDIVKVLQLRDQYIMPYYAPALIFVDRPGNMDDPKNVHTLNQIVIDFEVLPTSVGKSGTEFWLRDYYDFIDSLERISLDGSADSNPDSEMYKNADRNSTAISIKQHDLKNFLDWPEFRHWDGFLQFDFDEYGVEYLKSYFFKISSRADLRKWSNRAKLLNQLRNVADRYPEHEVYVFDDDAKFLDIIGTLLYQTIQSYGAVFITTFSIISIFIGVFGMLSIWDVDLDPIVMSALIMSIGFSVDIPAHIIYHFFAAGQDTIEASLQHCLGTIGFSVLQAAISTLLCLSSIQFSCLRMGHVRFVKTMVLVVTIGFIHGVVIIPVLYSILSRIQLPGRKALFKINTVTSPKTVTSPENLSVTLAIDAELKISIQ
ncbi:Patched family protein [Dirofilaria immitis]|nr:Patched family protein [Dirofilaria immitis]